VGTTARRTLDKQRRSRFSLPNDALPSRIERFFHAICLTFRANENDMKTVPFVLPLLLLCSVFTAISAETGEKAEKKKFKALNFTMKSLDGKDIDLSKYQGKVVMIVNVASKCGLTPQYEQLQALHEKYAKQGLAILGFPCNQFRSQEPGTAEEIKEFCRVKYGVAFDMFAKIEVNGDSACGLYKYLTALDTKPVGAGKISWNFEKFILNRKGEVVARFAPRTKPDDPSVIKVIEKELGKK
jgi:glutathione peroxidase